MIIKYKEYTLEPEGSSFNLFKDVKRKVKGVEKLVPDNMGWGMSFEHCIEVIIKDSLASREDTFSLREYIDEYKQLKCKILEETK